MKSKLFLLASLLLMATVTFAQGGKYTLKGTIKNADGETIYLRSGHSTDSTVVKKGKFTFKGKLDKPYERGVLHLGKSQVINQDTKYLDIALEPGKMVADIDATSGPSFREAIVVGGKTQQEMNELKEMIKNARGAKGNPTLDFIKSHPDSYISVEQLRFAMSRMSYQEVKDAYNGLTDNVKKYGDAETLKAIEKEIATLEKVQPGKPAPDFTANDINGKPFTMSSLKGHVVIIDFWASWCKPCRASNPHMLELYKKYRAKGLEMVYVSDDDSKPEAWHKAVAQDKLVGDGFHHVLRGLKMVDRKAHTYDKTNDISDKYAIHYLPTKYLIDQQGRIVCKIESNEQLDRELERLLGKAEYPFTINGTAANAEGKQVTLMYGTRDKQYELKSTVKDGRFELKGVLDNPYYAARLILGEWDPYQGGDNCELALSEGTFIIDAPTGKLTDATVKGGKDQDELNVYNAQLKPFMEPLTKMNKQYYAAKTDKQRDALRKKMEPLQMQYGKFVKDYTQTHPDSYITLQNISMDLGSMSYEELKKKYNSLSERVRLYGDTKEIESELAVMERTLPGAPAPDFTANDINGKPFTLSSLKGKVVILDFWASWCVPCRASNPHMKALYEKYHDKGLELVYVSDDDSNPNAWKKAVEKDGLKGDGFHHVLRGFKMNNETGERDSSNDISDKYAIHFLPTKYLIDREGRIVCKISEGEDDMLDKKLAEMMK